MQLAKLYLAEALIALLETKELEEIQIKELTDKAGVSRMTYYRYFQDKNDILSFYMDYIFEDYLNNIDSKINSPFQSYEHILKSLEHFGEYSRFTLCLYKAGLSQIMLDAVNRYVTKQKRFDDKDQTSSYEAYYYAGALYNTYLQWVLEDKKTPASKIAQIISKVPPHNN